jgi:Flp pilus assembly pilin Flp
MKQNVGATAIEYGILSALIAVTTIIALQSTGTNLGTTYCVIANDLSQAVGAGSTASGCSATSSSSSSSSSSSADSSGSSSSSADSSSNNSELASLEAEGISADYIDSSLGGNADISKVSGGLTLPASNFNDLLSSLNAKDEITGIYGLYRYNKGAYSPLSSYDDLENSPARTSVNPEYSNTSDPTIGNLGITDSNASKYVWNLNINGQNANGRVSESTTRGEAPAFEVTTASGKVYGLELTSYQNNGKGQQDTETYGMVNVKDSSDVGATTSFAY